MTSSPMRSRRPPQLHSVLGLVRDILTRVSTSAIPGSAGHWSYQAARDSYTHHGSFLLKRQTRRDRMRSTLRAIKAELRRRMHEPILEQGRWLGRVVRGYFGYHAIPTNARSLCAFRHHVKNLWRRSLRRRSSRDRTTWTRIALLADEFLPPARILHPWPGHRFAVIYPRWKPGA